MARLGIDDQAVDAVVQHLHDATRIGAHDRRPRHECLEHGVRQPLVVAGQSEDVGSGDAFHHRVVVERAHEVHVARHRRGAGQLSSASSSGPSPMISSEIAGASAAASTRSSTRFSGTSRPTNTTCKPVTRRAGRRGFAQCPRTVGHDHDVVPTTPTGRRAAGRCALGVITSVACLTDQSRSQRCMRSDRPAGAASAVLEVVEALRRQALAGAALPRRVSDDLQEHGAANEAAGRDRDGPEPGRVDRVELPAVADEPGQQPEHAGGQRPGPGEPDDSLERGRVRLVREREHIDVMAAPPELGLQLGGMGRRPADVRREDRGDDEDLHCHSLDFVPAVVV